MFNFVEEKLNQMTLFINEPIAISCIDSIVAGGMIDSLPFSVSV
jgi:hypothetical protein